MITSDEWTPSDVAWAQAASTAGNPSVSTAAKMATIWRSPSSDPASLRRTRSSAAGSTQSWNGAPLRSARACGPARGRSARDRRSSHRADSGGRVRRPRARPGGSRCDPHRHGSRPAGRRRWRSPSICCGRSGPGRSSTPRPAARGSRRTGRDKGRASAAPPRTPPRRSAPAAPDGDARLAYATLCRSARRSAHLGFDPQARREEALPDRPTWFSTWPFSHPDAGVQAAGSTR